SESERETDEEKDEPLPPSEVEVCAFCLDAKRDPVQLRCQHSFCRSCLSLFYQARNWPAKRCPLCRSDLEPLQKQIVSVN
ncbi:hypothetical protein KR093_006311, partial [Drosophila rubida]